MLDGKRVAIVGNMTPPEDLSTEIDNHDIVIRLNHFYNYDSGLVGKKVDMLFVTPTERWKNMSADERHENVIQEYKPLIFVVKHPSRITEEIKRKHFCDCKIYRCGQDLIRGTQVFTTGTVAIRALTNCENFICDCYCFSFEDNWKNYINTEAKHYSDMMMLEEQKRKEWIEMLKNKKIIKERL